MEILYKRIGKDIYYWSAIILDRKSAYIYKGKVGEPQPEPEILKVGFFGNADKILQKELQRMVDEGYSFFDPDQYIPLGIEYDENEMASEGFEDKSERLIQRLEDLLDDTYLGYTDDDWPGPVACMVLDFDLAKKLIEENLKGTEFENYKRIYNINLEPDDPEDTED